MNEETTSEVDCQFLGSLIVQNIDLIASATEIEPTTKVSFLSYYVSVKHEEFSKTGHIVQIEEAIEKQRLVLKFTNQDSEGFIGELDVLGILLELRYERLGGERDLEEAIEKAEETARVTPADHPSLAGYLNNLGSMLGRRYERTGQMADLELAIERVEEAMRVTPADHPDLALFLNNLGSMIELRYNRTGQVADLELAIERAEEAVRVTPADDPNLPAILSNLGNKLGSRYERTGQIVDLKLAIERVEEAVRVTPADHPRLATYLDNLGNKLESRYKHTGQVVDLKLAIERVEEAVRVTPNDHPSLAGYLSNLGNKLGSRYEHTGQIVDLKRAIERVEEAVRVTPADHPRLATYLNNLGNKLESRYKHTGQMADLELAIERAEEVVRLTPANHPDLAGYLGNLGSKLGRRYERTGQMTDLELAIERTGEAMRVTPADHPSLALFLNNLGNMLGRRYERTEQIVDLELAIVRVEEAVRIAPADCLSLGGYLNNLGSMLKFQYDRTGQLADLELAIKRAEEAVRVTPADHPELAGYLNNIGGKLARRYDRTGQMADLELAIKRTGEALRVIPADHPGLAGCLYTLASMLELRYTRTGQEADLKLAIEKAEEAVRMTPADHPELALFLNSLGQIQMLALDPMQTDNALFSFLRSWHCQSGFSSVRLRSAVAAVDLLINKKRWTQAAELAVDAINLLPLMNRRMLSRDDQQHILSGFTGLAAKACSLLLESGRLVEAAVEILEQGRGAILGLMIDDRRDVSNLQQLCPDEANNYQHLLQEVNTTPRDSMTGAVREQMLKRRAMAIKELEECIERIRAADGLEQFLLGSSAQQLQQQAHAGPIIIVNVTDIRSDAIIIEQRCIRSVNLPTFSAEDLRAWKRQDLTIFRGATFGSKNKKYRMFLSWIWRSCVQTVIGSLRQDPAAGYAARLGRRVWWIGVGEASTVPFHAAGDHSPECTDNTVSHVVSSYTPTVKALEFARERLAQTRRATAASAGETAIRKLCVVTMPDTPGQADLVGAASELVNIQKIATSAFSITSLPRPTAARVKEQLQSSQVFHFAGHGTADGINPFHGCLVLQKYDETGAALVPDPLSVEDVSRLHLPHAQLAYLSACSTAENSTSILADEVIHLVSAFQVAGFAQVVGSMWPSMDQICAEVAGLFYQNICVKDGELDADGLAAHALHSAIGEIRKQWWMEPLVWAQYVHFGA